MKAKTCKITAICNQKGGVTNVTKTKTTANLGIGLAMEGRKVLLVDIDPQADLTTSLGWKDTDSLPITLANLMEKVIGYFAIAFFFCFAVCEDIYLYFWFCSRGADYYCCVV